MRHSLIAVLSVLALCSAVGCDDDEGNDLGVIDLSAPGGADLAVAHDMASDGGGGGTVDMTSSSSMSASVAIMDNFYAPNMVTIAAGGTVTWTWGGASPHTVTSGTGTPSGMFDSSPPKASGTFSFTFAQPGTFPYYCQVHGAAIMSGMVIVK